MNSNVTHTVLLNKKPEQTDVDDGLVELMEALEEIDETKRNGGRILL